MPKISGIFDRFENLDQIPIENIAKWLTSRVDPKFLDNYVANRIIYPQAAPMTASEVDIDLAILREALKTSPAFYKKTENKMLIPAEFLNRLPDLNKLAWAFVDAFQPKNQTTFILIQDGRDEVLGTYLSAEFGSNGFLELNIEESRYKIRPGVTILPCEKQKCHINFKSANAKILGKTDLTVEIFGGRLGLIIDGR